MKSTIVASALAVLTIAPAAAQAIPDDAPAPSSTRPVAAIALAPGTEIWPAEKIRNSFGMATARALQQRVVTRGESWQVPWVLVAVKKPFTEVAAAWGMIAHATPIPWKIVQGSQMVTDHELGFLESLSTRTGAEVLVFGLRPANPYLSNVPELTAARDWLCDSVVRR